MQHGVFVWGVMLSAHVCNTCVGYSEHGLKSMFWVSTKYNLKTDRSTMYVHKQNHFIQYDALTFGTTYICTCTCLLYL